LVPTRVDARRIRPGRWGHVRVLVGDDRRAGEGRAAWLVRGVDHTSSAVRPRAQSETMCLPERLHLAHSNPTRGVQ
jgi:hypothetical protein